MNHAKGRREVIQGWRRGVLQTLFQEIRPRKKRPAGNRGAEAILLPVLCRQRPERRKTHLRSFSEVRTTKDVLALEAKVSELE